jgi:hypothetical protein
VWRNSYRVQCTGTASFLPDTRDRERSARSPRRNEERNEEGKRDGESRPRCFSCSPIRYINIPNRDSRRYTAERASASARTRARVVHPVRSLPRGEIREDSEVRTSGRRSVSFLTILLIISGKFREGVDRSDAAARVGVGRRQSRRRCNSRKTRKSASGTPFLDFAYTHAISISPAYLLA